MRKFLFVAAFLSQVALAQQSAPVFMAEGENLAQRLTAFALRQDVAAGDARVVQTKDWLAKAAKATGEDEKAVAAASVRAAKFFLDLTRMPATPLETLEAVARAAKPGEPMGDVLMHYVEARRAAPGKTHAEALQALGAR